MSLDKCIAIIKKAAGDEQLDDKIALELLDEIDSFITHKKNSLSPENLDQTIQSHLQERFNDGLLQVAIEKRNKIINTMVEARAISRIESFNNPLVGLKALMGGVVRSADQAKLSIDAQGKALANKYIGRVIDRIDKDGDLSLFNSGKLDDAIAAELWEIRPGGKPGASGNQAARRIANHIHAVQELAVKNSNQAGSYIKSMPGYVMRQNHDMLKLRKAGFEEWYNHVVNKLDHEKTFKGEDPVKFLKGAYKGLASGHHRKFQAGDDSNYLYGFKGPGNIAKKASQHRLLHFNSAAEFMEYNKAFGSGDLREGIVLGLDHLARNTALMRGLGTNPIGMLDKLTRRFSQQAADRMDFKMVDKLKSPGLQNLMKEIDGTTRIPGNLSLARINAGIRVVQTMSKLGSATVSSITDIANQAAELRFQGVPLLSAYSNAFGNIFRGRGSAEQKSLARQLGVGFDGITGELISRFSANDHIPGTMSKAQQKFFKLNLMSWWNDSHRTGISLMMSSNLAHMRKKSFSELGEQLTNVLKNYGISSSEWNLYRRHGLKKASDNRIYLTSEGLEDALGEPQLANYLAKKGIKPTKRAMATAKEELISKLDTFFLDRADSGIPMPGAAERAIMNQGTQAGTWVGEAFRHIFQFKSFPVTMLRRGIGRELYGNAGGKKDLFGLAQLMVSTTVFGYGAMYAKDLLKGREPRKFGTDIATNTKLFFAAMAQGGGLGIYGDFMFGEFSRYGRSFLSTAAGPTFGQFDDVADMWTRIRTGEDIAASSLRTAINNTPFINLFYTRMALDYLILYQLQEMVNPGYLRRTERRIMKENNQKFYMPPSRAIPHGGGSRLFEGVR